MLATSTAAQVRAVIRTLFPVAAEQRPADFVSTARRYASSWRAAEAADANIEAQAYEAEEAEMSAASSVAAVSAIATAALAAAACVFA